MPCSCSVRVSDAAGSTMNGLRAFNKLFVSNALSWRAYSLLCGRQSLDKNMLFWIELHCALDSSIQSLLVSDLSSAVLCVSLLWCYVHLVWESTAEALRLWRLYMSSGIALDGFAHVGSTSL